MTNVLKGGTTACGAPGSLARKASELEDLLLRIWVHYGRHGDIGVDELEEMEGVLGERAESGRLRP